MTLLKSVSSIYTCYHLISQGAAFHVSITSQQILKKIFSDLNKNQVDLLPDILYNQLKD
jgi:hypothetical protein